MSEDANSNSLIALNILRLVESAYHIHDPEIEDSPISVSQLPPAGASEDARIYRYLGRFQIFATSSDLPFEPNTVIEITSDRSVFDAFDLLVHHNVLSMPIRDPQSGAYLGLIDMVDLVHLAMTSFDQAKLTDLASLTGSADSIFVGSLADAANISSFNPFVAVPNGVALLAVMRLLGERGLRRICVTDNDGQVTGIISQSWLVRWLNIHKLAPGADLMNATVADLALVSGPDLVVSVPDNALAADAFKAMVDNGVTSCAIVDSNDGTLVTVVSVRDLKVLRGSGTEETDHQQSFSFTALFAPIMDFVSASRMQNLVTFPAVVGVRPTATLGTVIAKFASTGLHRVFVVDDKRMPVGVISLGDVIRTIPTRSQ
ncbi:uncharacterized protein AMSG_02230 [Thecamonas trahens ATCC 50062]|uniref:CBS domain-containing protein n=1 Tax=Thecamonas trahens ATCC 50062 TaxID=461836 RepID=A0A0L0DW09_THETB|nr:hypothetical protein AMSG_02230 [Thecamonas trahens ATCC 50062]KNC56261.1 hypothetical protein AMSG_02230 [Thecamonas trahens ATCC 50062]|eukprot:XP_013760783.1 hypothetical protein AMSG_02230 [Thecamonas trahens ATCC 50062]